MLDVPAVPARAPRFAGGRVFRGMWVQGRSSGRPGPRCSRPTCAGRVGSGQTMATGLSIDPVAYRIFKRQRYEAELVHATL